MTQMLNMSEVGELRTDEIVDSDESVTIGGSPFFRGNLNYIGNDEIEGNTSATYGVFTLAAKAGTRLNVLISGPPDGATQPTDINTISIDPQNGYCYTTTNRRVFVTYQGHGPIVHGAADALVNLAGFTLTAGIAKTLLANKEEQFRNYSLGYAYAGYSSGTPSSEVTVTISNGTESVTMTIPVSGIPSTQEFSEILKVTAAQTLTISTANGFGLNGWVIGLRGP